MRVPVQHWSRYVQKLKCRSTTAARMSRVYHGTSLRLVLKESIVQISLKSSQNQKRMLTKTRISRQQDRDEQEDFVRLGKEWVHAHQHQQRTPSALRNWPCWKHKGFSSASPNCSAGTGNTHTVRSNTPIHLHTHPHIQGGAGKREDNPSRKRWTQLEQRLTSYGENMWSVSPSSCLLFQPGRSSREPLITGSSPWEGGRGLRSLVMGSVWWQRVGRGAVKWPTDAWASMGGDPAEPGRSRPPSPDRVLLGCGEADTACPVMHRWWVKCVQTRQTQSFLKYHKHYYIIR